MADKQVTLNAKGMHCPSCAMLVEMNLAKIGGVKSAKVDYAHETAVVTFDDAQAGVDALVAAVNDAGYEGSLAG